MSSSYLELVECLRCLCSHFSSDFGSLKPLLLQIFFFPFSFLLSSPTRTAKMCVLGHLIVCQSFPWFLTFQSFFFLLLRFDNFHCFDIRFADSPFCPLELPLNPFSEFFIWLIVIFSSRISFRLSLGFLFLY